MPGKSQTHLKQKKMQANHGEQETDRQTDRKNRQADKQMGGGDKIQKKGNNIFDSVSFQLRKAQGIKH